MHLGLSGTIVARFHRLTKPSADWHFGSPKRGSGTWDEILKFRFDTLWQVDFFSKMNWTPTGLRQAFVLAFIHVGTRHMICSPCSFNPDATWMVSQAHAFIEQAHEADLKIEYLIRDRDSMYDQEFD